MQIFCWQSSVLKFTATMETANPFLDVEITARFTGPNGETLVLPGYWDGGKTYCVRFAPTAVGIWRYETSASNGDPGLAASGEIVCEPYTGELPIYRHGFLRVSSDRSHLEHADGTPFLWLGAATFSRSLAHASRDLSLPASFLASAISAPAEKSDLAP